MIATARIAWHVQHLRGYRSADAFRNSLTDYFVPMLATLMLASAGVALLRSSTISPKLIYAAAIALLYGACQNAWRFLFNSRAGSRRNVRSGSEPWGSSADAAPGDWPALSAVR